jgi:hypothetical protein
LRFLLIVDPVQWPASSGSTLRVRSGSLRSTRCSTTASDGTVGIHLSFDLDVVDGCG